MATTIYLIRFYDLKGNLDDEINHGGSIKDALQHYNFFDETDFVLFYSKIELITRDTTTGAEEVISTRTR